MCAGLNTEQMLLKDMKSVCGSLSLAVSVLYVRLEVKTHTHISAHATVQTATHSLINTKNVQTEKFCDHSAARYCSFSMYNNTRLHN